jgi:hypothetical protein
LHDQGQAFHDELETPDDHAPHLLLSVAVAVNERSLDVEVQPLFPQHGQKCREQSTQKGGEEDGLNLDDRGTWARPCGERELIRRPGCGVQQHGEGSEAHLGVVWAHLGLDVDDEGRGYGGEETGLPVHQWNAEDIGEVNERISRWSSSHHGTSCENPGRTRPPLSEIVHGSVFEHLVLAS